MEPSIKLGDVILVKTVKPEELKQGDVITFELYGENVTHRIIAVQDDGYQTKGDNNNIEDENIVKYFQIKGKVILTIPYLGKVMDILNNKIIFLIVVLIILILLFFKLGMEEKKQIRIKKKHEEDQKSQNQIY